MTALIFNGPRLPPIAFQGISVALRSAIGEVRHPPVESQPRETVRLPKPPKKHPILCQKPAKNATFFVETIRGRGKGVRVGPEIPAWDQRYSLLSLFLR